MRVAFLYNRAAEDPAQFAEDDDPSRSPVVAALKWLGHEVTPVACTLDLAQVRNRLEEVKPEVTFNRVESLGGSDAMAAAIPMLLDTTCIPYTGCHTAAIVATASKLSAKERLIRCGLPTPEWVEADFGLRIADCGLSNAIPNPQFAIGNPQFILKSVFEHASFEMDDTAVVGPAAPDEIAELVRKRTKLTGKPFFAERFVDGREFNLSLLGEKPQVLPPAVIDFSAFPTGKPRIVGYGAKWNDASFEFRNTPRHFDFPTSDAPLIRWLKDLAVECWRLFGLRGYARIDFRVDSAGQPWILEINTNPCIAPTSGFAAALEQGGLSYDDGIQRIIEAALPLRTYPSIAKRRPLAAN
ncbi:MAG: D-alanine--D-alanine ligase [Planctomycetes bacterium]|nr:D-alanine--D-alanine ligase [Planctomycetota bacterium]